MLRVYFTFPYQKYIRHIMNYNHHQLYKNQKKKLHEEKRSISNEFIPLWAMERNMYDKQEESESNEKESDDLISLDRDPRKPTNINTPGDGIDAAIDVNNEAWFEDHAVSRAERLQADAFERRKRRNDTLFLVIVGTCSLIGVLGLVAAAIFWYKIQKRAEAALDTEYPSYGVTGPGSSGSKISPSSTITDRKLAQSAQMFHYQQQRQQMMAQEKSQLDAKPVHSDDSDDEAPAGGDYTVYECPGLAPTGEMEVRNPLFAEPDQPLTSSTSTSHPTTNNHYPQPSSSPPKEKSLS